MAPERADRIMRTLGEYRFTGVEESMMMGARRETFWTLQTPLFDSFGSPIANEHMSPISPEKLMIPTANELSGLRKLFP